MYTFNIFVKLVYSHYLYKCDYLIPDHIHPCKHNNSFHQYWYSCDHIHPMLLCTHQHLNEKYYNIMQAVDLRVSAYISAKYYHYHCLVVRMFHTTII